MKGLGLPPTLPLAGRLSVRLHPAAPTQSRRLTGRRPSIHGRRRKRNFSVDFHEIAAFFAVANWNGDRGWLEPMPSGRGVMYKFDWLGLGPGATKHFEPVGFGPGSRPARQHAWTFVPGRHDFVRI